MQLTEDTSNGNTITHYSPNHLSVNGISYTQSLIITPTTIISPWRPQDIFSLGLADLAPLQPLNLEVVIIGSGETSQFPCAQVLTYFAEHQLGFEDMNTGAACRTYNVMASENRRVAALLFLS